MSDKEKDDLEQTEELHEFLQGNIPDGFQIAEEDIPRLTADQAWTVIWYLGNLYWQVKDRINRCEVCGGLYDSHCEGDCLDYGESPYHFCDNCTFTDEYTQKNAVNPDPEMRDD